MEVAAQKEEKQNSQQAMMRDYWSILCISSFPSYNIILGNFLLSKFPFGRTIAYTEKRPVSEIYYDNSPPPSHPLS